MKKYRRPPVVERVLSYGVAIPEELFERRLDAWKSQVNQSLPELETVTDWEINLTQKDGMPIFDTTTQRVTLRHRFWKGDAQHRDKGIQVWRDRVAFNLLRNSEDPRHFEELEAFAKEWLPRWAEIFEVKTVRGVTLEYVNLISPQTVPRFVDSSKTGIRLGEILPLCGSVPLQGVLVPPFRFEHNVLVTPELPLRLCTKLDGLPPQGNQPIHLRLLFTASTETHQRTASFSEVAGEVSATHALILEAFEKYFSDAAKLSFEPYDVVPSTAS